MPVSGAAPLSARRLRAWIASFELALDISHLTRQAALNGPDGSGAAGRRLMDAAARLPLALARAQAAGPQEGASRCLDDALACLAEMETHLTLCKCLHWIDAAPLPDFEARCAALRRELIALAGAARTLRQLPKERLNENNSIT